MAIKLGEAMVRDSLITREQLRLALERQVIFGGRIGTNIVELGIIKESELTSFLGKFFKVPTISPSQLASVDEETISCVSREVAEKYKLVPFKKERNRLSVVMMDPLSMASLDELRFITGYDIIPHVISELRLLYALEKYYGMERDLRYISILGKDEEQDAPKDKSKEHLNKVKEEFANAKNKEEIIGILLNEAKNVASRVAVLLVKEQKLAGWKAKGILIEKVEVSLTMPSTFTDVFNRKNYYRGPLLKIPGNEPMIKALSGTPQDCIIIPVHIREKIIAMLYADNGNSSVLDASLNYLNTLSTLASLSFEIIIMKNKIMSL